MQSPIPIIQSRRSHPFLHQVICATHRLQPRVFQKITSENDSVANKFPEPRKLTAIALQAHAIQSISRQFPTGSSHVTQRLHIFFIPNTIEQKPSSKSQLMDSSRQQLSADRLPKASAKNSKPLEHRVTMPWQFQHVWVVEAIVGTRVCNY